MSDDLRQIERRLTSGLERNDDALVQIETMCNWESYLIPAPTSIAILGQLTAIASAKDFSLDKGTPRDGFKYVKHPGSFRACLVQVSNEGCSAFTVAHKNMDAIRLYSSSFQSTIKDLVKLLIKGTGEQKMKLIPDILDELKTDAAKCTKLATETEAKFDTVVKLIDEINETSAEAKGVYEEAYQYAIEEKKRLEWKQQEVEKRRQEMDREKNLKIEELAKAKAAFEQCVDSLPSFETMMIMSAVEQTVQMATSFFKVLTLGFASQWPAAHDDKNIATSSYQNQKEKNPTSNAEELKVAYAHVKSILKCTCELYGIFPEDRSGKIDVNLSDVNKQSISNIKKKLEEMKADYKTSQYNSSNTVVECKNLCTTGILICDEMLSTKFDASIMFDKIKQLKDDTKKLELKEQQVNPKSSLSMENAIKACSDGTTNSKRNFEIAAENVWFKAELRKNELDNQRQQMEKLQKESKECHEEQRRVLEGLSKVKIDKINFEEIQKTLRDGMVFLAKLKEQWSIIVLFFLDITRCIDICITQKTSKADKRLKNLNYSLEDFTTDLLLEMAATANAAAYAVEYVAKNYTDISRKHLVPKIAALSGLLAYNPNDQKEDPRQKLIDDCKAAEEDIRKFGENGRAEMEQRILEMKRRIKEQCEDRLPPFSLERQKVIKETVGEVLAFKKMLNDKDESDYIWNA